MSAPDVGELLRRGAASIGCALDGAQTDTLLAYLRLLQRWGRVYNLTALSEPRELVTHHLLDSLAVVPSLRRQTGGQPFRLLDVGSGAGLPGLVVATALAQAQVTCIDAAARKAAFIRQATIELGLKNATAAHARVEQLRGPHFHIVVSRAFASLDEFTRLTEHLLEEGGAWLAMKARPSPDELGACRIAEVFHVEQIDVPYLAAARCLIWLRRR